MSDPAADPANQPCRNDVTKWLIEESRELGKQIDAGLAADERLLVLGTTLLSVCATVAVVNHRAYVLMALPFALSFLTAFVEYQHAKVLGLGGYKAVLEEAIAVRAGVPVVAWEHVVAPTLHAGRAVLSVRGMSVAFYLVAVFAAEVQAFATLIPGRYGHDHATSFIIATNVSILVGAGATLVALRDATTQYDAVASIARAELFDRWTRVGTRGP